MFPIQQVESSSGRFPKLEQVGLINLLVGKNKAGKTQLLRYLSMKYSNEAIFLESENTLDYLHRYNPCKDLKVPATLVRLIEPIVKNLRYSYTDDMYYLDDTLFEAYPDEILYLLIRLSFALYEPTCKILLIDEIDSGIYYTLLSPIWQIIKLVAKERKMQIFATTHSLECCYALADVCETGDEIFIHRLERNKPTSVVFCEEEIKIVRDRGIELR